MEQFLDRGKPLQMIFGTGNKITTPDALLYALYLKKRFPGFEYVRAFRWEYGNSEFHPKYYEFVYPDQVVALVGSSNLTKGGLALNHELSIKVSMTDFAQVRKSCQKWWKRLWKKSQAVTPALIRTLRDQNALGDERRGLRLAKNRQFLNTKLTRTRKPLFQYLLDENQPSALKHQLLAEADALTEKPRLLYLEILQHETGGGHQIQLPVASLGAFFGVGKGETKDVAFRFPTGEASHVKLTHFGNNTHRVRLRPLKDVPRPAIVVFKRTARTSVFDCKIVPPSEYQSTVRLKCCEQTRQDSRRWGLAQ